MEIKTNRDGHKKLWGDLAKSGSPYKFSSDIWDDPAYRHLIKRAKENECFACAEARFDCVFCPISWFKNRRGYCCDFKSPFDKWDVSGSEKERKRLAKIIRDLPWRKRR